MAHDHAPATFHRAFAVGVALNVIYIAVEIVAGLSVNSMALLADAGHNTSDVLSLLLAWGASYLSQRPPSPRRTYGLRKSSILASLTNALLLLIAIGAIAWESVRRFADPQPVSAGVIMVVAGIGVAVNTATALLFLRGRKGDLNIRGAFLHMAADAGVSAGVVLAGLLIGATGLLWIDPAISLLIVVVIAAGTWGLLRDSLNLALDAVPAGIDPAKVRRFLEEQPGVLGVHDLHIWAMSTTETALTAHLSRTDPAGDEALLSRLSEELHHEFEIAHTTLQLGCEASCHGCETA